jgi:hypothetical protein
MQELEHYMKELILDIMEIVDEATVEEKEHLHKHLATLISKLE